MAILTPDQKAELRRSMAVNGETVRWTKGQIDSVFQKVEDLIETNRTVFYAAIDTITAPLVLTNVEKLRAFAAFFKQKAERGG